MNYTAKQLFHLGATICMLVIGLGSYAWNEVTSNFKEQERQIAQLTTDSQVLKTVVASLQKQNEDFSKRISVLDLAVLAANERERCKRGLC